MPSPTTESKHSMPLFEPVELRRVVDQDILRVVLDRRPVEEEIEEILVGRLLFLGTEGCGQLDAHSIRSGAFCTSALASLPTSSYLGAPVFDVS